MRRTFNFEDRSHANICDEVNASLVAHVYAQGYFAQAASLFCALVVFVGLLLPLPHADNNFRLYIWFGFYLFVTFLRASLVYVYRRQPQRLTHQNYMLWQYLYTIGATLGGISWGFAAFLLPVLSPLEQVLVILMLAGVTAGSVPLSIGVLSAAILFLLTALTPFLIYFVTAMQMIFYLFAAALTLYTFYSIILTINGFRTIRQSIELQYENADLLKNLSQAKHQLELTNEKLEYAATHDHLTHVANRSLFEMNLKKTIKYASDNHAQFSLLYFDLDRFKNVNDVYGHHIGDRVLVIIVNRLIQFFHGNENIARLGGEEFTIILKDIYSIEKVEKISAQICQIIAEPIVLKGICTINVTASIGISIFPVDGQTMERLIWHADQSMYAVKEHGGNHYSFGKELV